MEVQSVEGLVPASHDYELVGLRLNGSTWQQSPPAYSILQNSCPVSDTERFCLTCKWRLVRGGDDEDYPGADNRGSGKLLCQIF